MNLVAALQRHTSQHQPQMNLWVRVAEHRIVRAVRCRVVQCRVVQCRVVQCRVVRVVQRRVAQVAAAKAYFEQVADTDDLERPVAEQPHYSSLLLFEYQLFYPHKPYVDVLQALF